MDDFPLIVGIWLLVRFHNIQSQIMYSVFTNRIYKTVTGYFIYSLRHPTLTDDKHKQRCLFGVDSWEDTKCAIKNDFVGGSI